MKNENSPRANLGFFVMSILCQLIGFGIGLLFREASLRFDLFFKFDTSLIALCALLLFHSVGAYIAAKWLNLPIVWLYFNLLIAPTIVAYESFGLPSEVLLLAVIISVLIYFPTLWTRVPYYPTSTKTYQEILTLLPNDRAFTFIDLGCGFGWLLTYLAKHRPLGEFIGVEISPLPYFMSWLRSKLSFRRNIQITAKSFWKVDCSQYDFIYAFLSPAPMPKLWEKLSEEMKNEATFICNSFPVPSDPVRTIVINDKRECILYLYRIN